MSTWHQDKAGPIAPPTTWTIETNPPNGMRTRMEGFLTRQAAEERLAEWRRAGNGHYSYVIGPPDEKSTREASRRYFLCGTRAVIRPQERGAYRVVCATCGAGGSVPRMSLDRATEAATRDSGKPCNACGAS